MNKILIILSLLMAAGLGCGNRRKPADPAQYLPPTLIDFKNQNTAMPPFPPEYGPEHWINSSGNISSTIKGKIVLIDFWEYACVNCIRTIPYLKGWYERYHGEGVEFVGIHTPEFEFGKDRRNVEAAIVQFKLPYPVVLDNDYRLWKSYGNHYWPAKFLFDRNGILRFYHAGEGGYAEMEQMIQKLLGETTPSYSVKPAMEALRDEDKPGKVCYRATPELYLGYERGIVANVGGYHLDTLAIYEASEAQPEDSVMLPEAWHSHARHIIADAGKPSELTLSYAAGEVNLVLA